jgi:hypothetical protein
MGHCSIQVTVDIYGHLIPGANVSFVDKLDSLPQGESQTTRNTMQLPRNRRKLGKTRFLRKLLI